MVGIGGSMKHDLFLRKVSKDSGGSLKPDARTTFSVVQSDRVFSSWCRWQPCRTQELNCDHIGHFLFIFVFISEMIKDKIVHRPAMQTYSGKDLSSRNIE